MTVRRFTIGNSVSMATVRFASSPWATAQVVASSPIGVTTISAFALGFAPVSTFAPSLPSSSDTALCPSASTGLTQTLSGRAAGVGASGGTMAFISAS